ncbi:MAG: hypothetical protein ABIH39_00030 [Candidatus Margulisiibacteriota bacterium]
MPKKDSRTQLLDDIIRSVSKKKDIVKPFSYAVNKSEQVIEFDGADASIKQTDIAQHPVLHDDSPVARDLRKKLFKSFSLIRVSSKKNAKSNDQKLFSLFAYNLATGFARGVGVLLGISVTMGVSLLIITDLMGLPRFQKFAGAIINWLRLVLS